MKILPLLPVVLPSLTHARPPRPSNTIPNPLEQLTSLSVPISRPVLTPLVHCEHGSSWAPEPLTMEDCTAALHRFFDSQVKPHMDTDFEFLGINAAPRFKPYREVAVTPRKYDSGTCVLAIAMMNFYPSNVLSERGPGPFQNTDISRFLDVWWMLHDVIFTCRAPGWAPVGEEQSIGVFAWKKGSALDRGTPSGTI
ncbi:MAG: hypothetical protein LQ338_003362 [Usnochroma carphineum]|nr:MAG: hypothetical protein LQ338_003362 [Usnochroma carphineum]